VAHYNDIARLAVLGSAPSECWKASISKPFTGAEVRYFTEDDIDTAREWVSRQPASGASHSG
jgi:hypothetical protein